jgi:hypothetical protein
MAKKKKKIILQTLKWKFALKTHFWADLTKPTFLQHRVLITQLNKESKLFAVIIYIK